MKIAIPELALVVLVGPSGSGKSTFARQHFLPTEVLSSDFCRGLVSDNENDQSATTEAFEVLHFVARKRLAAGRLTVIDATNVQFEARKPLVALAREFHTIPVALVFDLPEKLCQERNRSRADRDFGPHVVRLQARQLRRSLHGLQREGFRHTYVFSRPEELEGVQIERQPLWNNRRSEHGPFDIIGDIHGCLDELVALLAALGYSASRPAEGWLVAAPAGRKVIFLGDLMDRGPNTAEVLRLVMSMVEGGQALCVPGNHDVKLMKRLGGRQVQLTHGLAETMAQLEAEPAGFREKVGKFLEGLVSHYVLDDGKLVVAHAGMKEEMQGRGSRAVREFALFGETTGETDEFGLPIRYNWAADYRGRAMVVYGHTPVAEAEWLNRTMNIDTGCVYGGKLTALRYPEKELVSVPALRVYHERAKPLEPAASASPVAISAGAPDSGTEQTRQTDIQPLSVQHEQAAAPRLSLQHATEDLLDIDDVLGKRIVSTHLHGNVTIREENAIAALEAISRFAVNPRWLVYLPPTMSPSETTRRPGLLEHPDEAFAYYAGEEVGAVVCQQKHMGSRAVVIVCRNRDAAFRRFGVVENETGICYTRTGRRFFSDPALEAAFLERVRDAVEAAGLWDELQTDWLCLDGELMPWSAKAQELLRHQYARAGAAARAGLREAVACLAATLERQPDAAPLLDWYREREAMAAQFVVAYRRYCWPVNGLLDLKLAPFHVLAGERGGNADRDHTWHMETCARICGADTELLLATPYRVVELASESSRAEAVAWWEELTGAGGEGMVVKPLAFVARNRRLAQPAVKCRGREYLRIIYGPEYTAPVHLDRLRARGLGAKRSLALREFALGIEALERFVQREPLRRVHECVFGVLALESEPVDPRL